MRPELRLASLVGGIGWLLVACQAETGPTAMGPIDGPQTIRVAPLEAGRLELSLDGITIDDDPLLVDPVTPWLPVEAVVPDGQQVAAGDPLIALALEVLELWVADREVAIALEEARLAQRQLQAGRAAEDLRLRREELQAKAAVREAAVVATRERDGEAIRIAAMQLEDARRQLAQTSRRVADIRTEHEAGRASGRQLREALRDLERAELAVELPRIRHEIISEDSKSVTRFREQIALGKLLLELGDADPAAADGGIAHRLAAQEEREAAKDRETSRKLQKMHREQERDLPTLADPVVRAPVAGVARHAKEPITVGSRFAGRGALAIIDAAAGDCLLEIPEGWRGLLTPWSPEHPERGRVLVSVPALGLQGLPARIASVQTITPEDRGKAQRVHLCRVRLDEVPTQLRVGMRCQVRIDLPAAGLGLLPIWALTDLRQPTVLDPSGAPLPIAGRRIGDDFLVTDGLAPGDVVRLPRARERSGNRRLVGFIEAAEQVVITGWLWCIRIVEMLPDGTDVAAGDVVARLVGRDEETAAEVLEEVAIGEAEAEAAFLARRLQVEVDAARARVGWRTAVLEYELARVAHLVERYGGRDETLAAARVDRRLAELDLVAAEDRLAVLGAPANRANVTDQELADARRRVARARLELRRAELADVAARRGRDVLAVARAEAEERAKADARDAARRSLTLARIEQHTGIASARERLRSRHRRLDRQRERADQLEMRAPVAGRLFHNPNRWEPLSVGDRLRVQVPFFIPTGPRRRLRLDVPGHLFGRYRVGQAIPVHVPALREEPIPGRVAVVGDALRIPDDVVDEILLRGTAGVVGKVFTLVIDLDCPPELSQRILPGAMAWIEEAP